MPLHRALRCELLTIFYLYKVLCSQNWTAPKLEQVVNCLQFFIFTRFFAVFANDILRNAKLWIAYNFLSLQGSLQFVKDLESYYMGCELLTIFYLYKVLCSNFMMAKKQIMVVNCLQFFIFTRFFAVVVSLIPTVVTLWIAYNFLSLQGSLQFSFFK